jgi:hypothetical protein
MGVIQRLNWPKVKGYEMHFADRILISAGRNVGLSAWIDLVG